MEKQKAPRGTVRVVSYLKPEDRDFVRHAVIAARTTQAKLLVAAVRQWAERRQAQEKVAVYERPEFVSWRERKRRAEEWQQQDAKLTEARRMAQAIQDHRSDMYREFENDPSPETPAPEPPTDSTASWPEQDGSWLASPPPHWAPR